MEKYQIVDKQSNEELKRLMEKYQIEGKQSNDELTNVELTSLMDKGYHVDVGMKYFK